MAAAVSAPRPDPGEGLGPDLGCPDAEVFLLGCLLRLPAGRVLDVAHRLQPEDLVDPRHRLVLRACARVAHAGHAPDPALVLGQLRRDGLEGSFTADRAAAVYLADLLAAAGTLGSVEAYRRIVVEHAYRRRVVAAAQRLEESAGVLALDELRDLLEQEVDAVRAVAGRLVDRPGRAVRAVSA